jgi:hypothetical protein
MPLQILFHSLYLGRCRRAKSSLIVDIDDTCILKADNHIWMMIAIDISKAERDRDEILACAIELRPCVDARFRHIPTRKIDHLNSPVEVERDKVARITRRVILPHDCVDLFLLVGHLILHFEQGYAHSSLCFKQQRR